MWQTKGMTNLQFAQILKNKRELKNGKGKRISFSALSKLVGVSSVSLFRYEQGTAYPSPKVLKKLCDTLELDFQTIYLLIQSEKAPKETRGYFKHVSENFPELRTALLNYYDPGISAKSQSLNEITATLNSRSLHPIEKSVLNAVLQTLKEKAIFGSEVINDPMEFFKQLNSAGKRARLDQAKFKWAHEKDTGYILYQSFDNDNAPEELKFILPDESAARFPNERLFLIDHYSKSSSFYEKCFLPYQVEIVRDISCTSFHPIEEKILKETKKHGAGMKQNNLKYADLNTLEQYLEFWNFDEETQALSIALKEPKALKPLIKKFVLWYELIPRQPHSKHKKLIDAK